MLPPLPFQPVRWPILAAIFLPVLGAALAVWAHGRPRTSRAIVIGTQSASVVALGISLVRLLTLPALRRELMLGTWPLVDAGALRIEPTFVFDAVSGPLALAVAAGSLVLTLLLDDATQSRGHRLARQLLPAAAVLALLADDAPTVVGMLEAMALAIWALARTAGHPVPPARSAVAARFGTWSFVVASLVLFWSLGATGWSQEGYVQRETSLAVVTGRLAAHDIVEKRADPVPVGVEEAMAHGDGLASTAGWIVPGPSLSRRDIAEAIRVPSTGVAGRLEKHRLYGFSVPSIVILFVLFAIAGVAMFVPFRGALTPPSPLPPGVAPYLGWVGVAVGIRLALGWRDLAVLSPIWEEASVTVGVLTLVLAAFAAARSADIQRCIAHATVACGGLALALAGTGAATEALITAVLTVLSGSAAAAGCAILVPAGPHGRSGTRLRGLAALHPVAARFVVLGAAQLAILPAAVLLARPGRLSWLHSVDAADAVFRAFTEILLVSGAGASAFALTRGCLRTLGGEPPENARAAPFPLSARVGLTLLTGAAFLVPFAADPLSALLPSTTPVGETLPLWFSAVVIGGIAVGTGTAWVRRVALVAEREGSPDAPMTALAVFASRAERSVLPFLWSAGFQVLFVMSQLVAAIDRGILDRMSDLLGTRLSAYLRRRRGEP